MPLRAPVAARRSRHRFSSMHSTAEEPLPNRLRIYLGISEIGFQSVDLPCVIVPGTAIPTTPSVSLLGCRWTPEAGNCTEIASLAPGDRCRQRASSAARKQRRIYAHASRTIGFYSSISGLVVQKFAC
jgi:hypothetical protein